MAFMRNVCLTAAVLLCASSASAQTATSGIGITIGYPASIGVLVNTSDAIAVRPELSFTTTSISPTSDVKSTSHSFTIGADALFYLHTYDRVRTYVAPHLDYSHASSSGPSSSDVSITNHGIGVAGSFGAQYTPTDRFGIFGEVGLGFTHSSLSSNTFGSGGTVNGWGTRAGVGVIFYP